MEDERWPKRSWLLAGLGLVAGVAIHLLAGTDFDAVPRPSPTSLKLALATWIGIAGVVLSVTLTRQRWAWAAGFSILTGFVVASVIFWNGGPDDWNAADGWRLLCAVLAVAIAAPLFQTARDEGRWRLPYRAVHANAWANVMVAGAALLLVGVTWLMVFLLSALFELIGIDLLIRLVREGWFIWALNGAAFGGFVGMLREHGRIPAMLQRVVLAILSVLAPVLAAGLLLFLLSLPFTGLAPLWEATKATTPILLGCCLGAVLLANCVIGDGAEDEARNRLFRFAGAGLAVAVLPFAIIAAVSTGLRIDQYGLTPSRLWAVVFCGVATAWGLAYWVALGRGRLGWAAEARPANLRLALGLCAVALLLSTPLISFGAISTADQLARLKDGRTPAERFDWTALAFDFGPSGRRAVERLAKEGGSPVVREQAAAALKAENRYASAELDAARLRVAKLGGRLRVLPAPRPLPPALMRALGTWSGCGEKGRCLLYYPEGAREALVVREGCAWRGEEKEGGARQECMPETMLLREENGWRPGAPSRQPPPVAEREEWRRRLDSGRVEIRDVTRRQVFVDGHPVGDLFE